MIAANQGHTEMVHLLLKEGNADTTLTDSYGKKAIGLTPAIFPTCLPVPALKTGWKTFRPLWTWMSTRLSEEEVQGADLTCKGTMMISLREPTSCPRVYSLLRRNVRIIPQFGTPDCQLFKMLYTKVSVKICPKYVPILKKHRENVWKIKSNRKSTFY